MTATGLAWVAGEGLGGDGPLHRVDARVKLLGTLAYAALLLLAPDLPATLGFAACTLAAVWVGRLPWRELWARVAPLSGLLALTVLAEVGLGRPGTGASWLVRHLADLRPALLTGWRLWLLGWQSAVLAATTPPFDLVAAAADLLEPLRRRGWPTDDWALMAGMALRFIPTVGEEGLRILRAQAARGEPASGLGRRWRLWVALWVPVFVGVFRRAQELAVALEVRDWGAGPRSRWRARPWAREDAVAAAAVAALAAWLAVGRLLGL